MTVAKQILKDYAPSNERLVSYHIPKQRAAARENHSDFRAEIEAKPAAAE